MNNDLSDAGAKLNDDEFKKLVLSAEDSYIVFSANQITILKSQKEINV